MFFEGVWVLVEGGLGCCCRYLMRFLIFVVVEGGSWELFCLLKLVRAVVS